MVKPPGLVDVAKVAGVSHMTVSRVLSGHPTVREETRRRVMLAVDELGYRRNSLARAFKGESTATIGVVLAGEHLYELGRVLQGIEQATKAQGYWLNLAAWHGGPPEDLTETLNRLVDQSVDGIVMIADRPLAVEALQRIETRVPVVVVMSGTVRNPAVGSVEVDQGAGARVVTRHLLGLGHRDVVHLSGPRRVYDARARASGFRAAVKDAGGQASTLEGDFSPESGYDLARRLLASPSRPTAVFAGNDFMAMGVLAAFAEVGARVPEDFSLVGFDDVHGAGFLVPALTTVRQDYELLGSSAIESLFRMLKGEGPDRVRLRPELVERRSTGPVAASGH